MAMTMLEYGLESQAPFSLLTGDIGSGKTTLVRRLLRQLGDQVVVGLISNTHAHFKSIHGWALSALGVVPAGDTEIALYEALVDAFVREYREGRRTLLIFDEAQNLSIERLEELRLLSNVNSESDTVLQILLVGQPELRNKLSLPELQQFAQRISVDFHLTPLGRAETHAYIRHRLEVAEGNPDLFQPAAIEFMFARTQGVPRLLNRLADFALVYAFADQRATIDEALIAEVARDRRTVSQATAGVAADKRISQTAPGLEK
jgi:type II secretory pathway predicted ATPase ExeA